MISRLFLSRNSMVTPQISGLTSNSEHNNILARSTRRFLVLLNQDKIFRPRRIMQLRQLTRTDYLGQTRAIIKVIRRSRILTMLIAGFLRRSQGHIRMNTYIPGLFSQRHNATNELMIMARTLLTNTLLNIDKANSAMNKQGTQRDRLGANNLRTRITMRISKVRRTQRIRAKDINMNRGTNTKDTTRRLMGQSTNLLNLSIPRYRVRDKSNNRNRQSALPMDALMRMLPSILSIILVLTSGTQDSNL